MNSKCPVCGGPIMGRIDKRFCSDQCRYLNNNKNKIVSEAPILQLNRMLRRNRSILKSLCPAGKATVRKEVMENLGYCFSVFTSLFMNSQRQVYYLCYDYGFMPLMDRGIEKALIISKQDYMAQWQPWKYVKLKTSS